jgi:6-pyruvoyltetrahydropterin/6-carboxytetrahydropterin synthase
MKKTKMDIVRKGKFDSAHTIVEHVGGCGSLHGHTYHYKLCFSFTPDLMEDPELGYSMDFSEIKRIAGQFIDDYFDHGYVSNPTDYLLPTLQTHANNKIWIMSLNGEGVSCNPSAENMAKELFLAIDLLFLDRGITLKKIILYETESCYVKCKVSSITLDELENFNNTKKEMIERYRFAKGIKSYNKNKQ